MGCVTVVDPDDVAAVLDPVGTAAREAEDVLLVYFAGHGLLPGSRRDLHLAVGGSNPEKPWTAVPYTHVADLVRDSAAAVKVVILDCCYSGRAIGVPLTPMGIDAQALEQVEIEGVYVITSTTATRLSYASPDSTFTAFTGALLEELTAEPGGADEAVPLARTFEGVRRRMRAAGLPEPQQHSTNTAAGLALVAGDGLPNRAGQEAVAVLRNRDGGAVGSEAVERHVQPVRPADEEQPSLLDGDGFLDLDSATDLMSAANLAGWPKSFVLIGPGGVGKSEVLGELRRLENGFEVDLVGQRGADISAAVRAGVVSGRPVYLDSLDEALLTEPALARLVNRAITGAGTDGVKWRLACRPSAWTSAFVSGVADLDRLRLLPLTRGAAHRLLASLGVDEGFLDAVVTAGQSRLSASLLHFIAAARQWQIDGRFTHRRTDVLESEVQRLLAEREDVRPPLRTGGDVRRRAAGRLAFFAAFGGIGRYAFRTSADQAGVAIADLPTGPEPDRPDIVVGRDIYEEVLGSALFDTASGDTVAFRHQEYVDYLSGKYVVDRAPVRSQIAGLLGLTDGVLPRSRAAVAAWMVALRPEIADLIAPANAATLIESEVELPPAARAVVVDALLADARENDAPPHWSLDLSLAAHPGLERQLTDRIEAGFESPFEGWWLFRLALAGRVAAVTPAALATALDHRAPSWARRVAINVVCDLGATSERSALLEALNLDADEDPDDEVRAALLDGLYPQYMTTTRLLPLLTRPRRFNFIGAYRKFLRDLAGRVPTADLPEMLSWMHTTSRAQVSIESRSWLRDAVDRTVARALAESDDSNVLVPLSEFVIDMSAHSGDSRPWAQDAAQRRQLALAAAAKLDGQRWPILLQRRLVTADDVEWLLDVISDENVLGRDVLAHCFQRLAAVAVAEPDLDEEPADQPDPSPLRAAVAAAQRDLDLWADIPLALTTPADDLDALFSCDLTARRGWSLLTADEQDEVLDRGIDYVINCSPDPGLRLNASTIKRDVVRAWSGVYLMTTVARYHPERIGELPTIVWERWAPAIASAWAYDNEDLLRTLVGLAPAEAMTDVRAAVRAVLDDRGTWQRKPLYEHFARDLTPALVTSVQQRRYSDDENTDVLAFLIKHDEDAAVHAARSAATGDGSQLSRAANRYLASVDSNDTVDRLLNETLESEIFLELLESLSLEGVDDHRLGALSRLLFDRYPFVDDDPRETEGWRDTPARRGAQIRNRMVALMAMRGQVAELLTLADGRPPLDQALIRHYLGQARRAAADTAQIHLTPTDLLDLLGRSDLRLIRNAGDLTKAVLDHLDELQHELARNNGFRDVWSPDRKRLGTEDDITDWVRRRLADRLGRGRVLLARETQVERLAVRGLGTRIDLTIDAPTNTAPSGVAGTIIEAKLVSNDEVPTALQQQLVDRYLAATGQRHGIYLVYWLPPKQRISGSRTAYPDKHQLLNDMQQWAADVAPQYAVSVYVLDVSWPDAL